MGGGGMIYGGGDVMDGKQKMGHDQPVDSIFGSSPSNSFLGSRAMVSFGAFGGVNGSGSSFYLQNESGDEYLDEFYNQPEKKRRLTVDQVQFLEKSFEADNRLEPDRKILLAKELGLQPRQIGVWFQNRRARCKTKNLETDYETLSASYTSLKTDYDILLKENEKLKAEVLRIKQNGVAADADNANRASYEMISEDEESGVLVKGNVTYVENPWLTNEIRSSFFESRNFPEGFEPYPSDLSQHEEFNMNANSFQQGKIEDAYCYPHSNSCNYGFPVEDNAFSFWSY